MKLPTSLTGFDIQKPTDDDFEWAKKTYKTKSSDFHKADGSIAYPLGHWRLAFLLQIPDHGKFTYYGLSRDQKQQVLNTCIENQDIKGIRLCTTLAGTQFAYHTIKHAIQHTSVSFLKDMAKAYPKEFPNICKKQACILEAAIDTGNLDIVQLVHKHGADIVTNHLSKIEYALSQKQPQIAKYLTQQHDSIQEEAGLKEKAKPMIQTNDDEKWERMSQSQIAKHSSFDSGMQSLTEIFNFDSQQITTVQNNARLKSSSSFVQNFSQLPSSNYVDKAADKLTQLGGEIPTLQQQAKRTPLTLPIKQG